MAAVPTLDILGTVVVSTPAANQTTITLQDIDDDFPLVVIEIDDEEVELSSFFYLDQADLDRAYHSSTPDAAFDAAKSRAAAAASRARQRVAALMPGRTLPGLAMQWVVDVVRWAGYSKLSLTDAYESRGFNSIHYRRAAASALGRRQKPPLTIEVLESLQRKFDRFGLDPNDTSALARVADHGYYGVWGYTRDGHERTLNVADFIKLNDSFADLAF